MCLSAWFSRAGISRTMCRLPDITHFLQGGFFTLANVHFGNFLLFFILFFGIKKEMQFHKSTLTVYF